MEFEHDIYYYCFFFLADRNNCDACVLLEDFRNFIELVLRRRQLVYPNFVMEFEREVTWYLHLITNEGNYYFSIY